MLPQEKRQKGNESPRRHKTNTAEFGADAVKAVEKYASRLEYVHLKDFRAAKEANEPDGHRIVSLYKGNVPLDSILSALKKAGTKVAYVEQDNAVEKNSYEEMKNSYEALKERGWTN